MKKSLLLLLAVSALAPASLMAQSPIVVDRSKYPDYTDVVHPDASLLKYGGSASTSTRKGAKRAQAVSERPAVWNNASTKHFPPVFNQHGGSCGAASRIAYMFTHEANSYRDADGSKYENQYPTHFVFLHTMGNSGKNEFVRHIGIPNAPTWGGRTYSSIFGEFGDWTSHEYGWMQGYDRWYSAMFNRANEPVNLPVSLESEEGREALKNYLWNHNGDTDFKSGGIVGVGVASGGNWQRIPQTNANDAAGVTNMYYVKEWGTSVDHALTIVGYDDRIEFDIDGNGVAGEKDKDEVGAWIIVNSWGEWCNNGFIYCPYARAVPVKSDASGRVSGWWQPEVYHFRKDYRPFRTLKVKMDYSHRSEIKLIAGVAKNLNATAPEKSIELEYFRFAGDGNNGDSNPAPATPMLGKWSDGRMHTEPMEFGYDLTDLSSGFDRSQPLKYFFQVYARTKRGTGAIGSGNIYAASIIDYEHDLAGNETPFKIEGTKAVPGGQIVTISTIVYGEQYNAPLNPSIENGEFCWQAPIASGRQIDHYNVYKDGSKLGETTQLKFATAGDGNYAVAAVYQGGTESKTASCITAVAAQSVNTAVNFKQNGFIIPDVFDDKYDLATIEYWIKPNSLSNWNNSGGPGWGNFMFHANDNGTFTAGWNTSDRTNSNTRLSVGKWSHVAMVVAKNNFRIHIDGGAASTVGSTTFSGLGGFGDLVFNNSGNGANDATYDEIRIWGKARSQSELTKTGNVEFTGELMPQQLLAYYKGDVITINGEPYLRDCVGGHHAPIVNKNYEVVNNERVFSNTVSGTLFAPGLTLPKDVTAGQIADFSATYSDNVKSLVWNIEGTTINNLKASSVSTTFANPGSYVVRVTATDANGNSKSTEKTIVVAAAPAPQADFELTATQIPAGERVSFSPTTPQAGYTYDWSMPGAVNEHSNAVTAGATYERTGSFDIKLTVTSPTGAVASTTKKVKVVQVAPQAAFSVLTPVVVKGQNASIKDESKFEPSSWTWQINSRSKVYTITDAQNPNAAITEPGIYDVTLLAKNASGMHSTTQERALIVANADSKNGLTLAGNASATLQQSPISNGETAATVEWWMNPAKLGDYCCGIGESDESFHIKVAANGSLVVAKNGRTISTPADVVKAGEWHHYAVVIANNSVRVYCDGKRVLTGFFVGNTLPEITKFSIGTESAKMSASIDEFRVWGTALNEEKLKLYANEPIADVAAAQTGTDKLLLYYDFNQTSGAVIDRSSNGNNATRTGFGPDGDAWALSRGVFSLNFAADAAKDVSNLLHNYKRSFAYDAAKQINSTDKQTNRWYALKEWTIENTQPCVSGSGTTGAHVDAQKNYCLTIATQWDGFAQKLEDHKVYQVLTLPAGVYTLTATYSNTYNHGSSAAPASYLVVAQSNSLPNTDDLSSALAYNQMSATGFGAKNSLTFTLTQETQVAIGMLVNMSGQSIAIIDNFKLTRSEVDNVTAIRSIEELSTDNGSTSLFDLSGRRVNTPQRGQIYIQGKQRILVK